MGFFPFYLRDSALACVLIYVFKIHMDRGSNFTFLRELQAELGIESRCDCGLLSLAYALVAPNGQVIAVLAKRIRKKVEICKSCREWSLPMELPFGQEKSM